tara:strand:+ start:287 stop:523 length:237 start_codon:yes stop_codon:yes gene_type:complete
MQEAYEASCIKEVMDLYKKVRSIINRFIEKSPGIRIFIMDKIYLATIMDYSLVLNDQEELAFYKEIKDLMKKIKTNAI